MTPDTVRAEFRGGVSGFGSYGGELGGALWIGMMLIAAPLILFLILVGLIYELVVRIGRHRLPPLSDWALSFMAAVALVGVGGVTLVHLVWPG